MCGWLWAGLCACARVCLYLCAWAWVRTRVDVGKMRAWPCANENRIRLTLFEQGIAVLRTGGKVKKVKLSPVVVHGVDVVEAESKKKADAGSQVARALLRLLCVSLSALSLSLSLSLSRAHARSLTPTGVHARRERTGTRWRKSSSRSCSGLSPPPLSLSADPSTQSFRPKLTRTRCVSLFFRGGMVLHPLTRLFPHSASCPGLACGPNHRCFPTRLRALT